MPQALINNRLHSITFNNVQLVSSILKPIAWAYIAQSAAAHVEQVISCPQHMGDFTLPCPLGHSETCTVLPSAVVMVLCRSSLPHLPQVMVPILIPHFSHLYAAIGILLLGSWWYLVIDADYRKITKFTPHINLINYICFSIVTTHPVCSIS